MHSAWFRSTFLRVLNFLQIIERGHNFGGEPILQKVWIIWWPLLYFNFQGFMDPNWSSFIRFQCILEFKSTFLRVLKFLEIKEKDLISEGNQFCRKSELFGPLFCISILKVLWTQIDHLLLDFNALCMIQEYFYQSLEICTN